MKLDWRLQFSQRRSQLLMSGLMCCLGIGIGCIPQAGGGAPVIVSYAPAATPSDSRHVALDDMAAFRAASPAEADEAQSGFHPEILGLSQVYTEQGPGALSFAEMLYDVLSAREAQWLSGIYGLYSMEPAGALSLKGVSLRFVDGDGTAGVERSNMKDIIAMTNVYYAYGKLDGWEAVQNYAISLWEASHQYTYELSPVYYCDGCLDSGEEATASDADRLLEDGAPSEDGSALEESAASAADSALEGAAATPWGALKQLEDGSLVLEGEEGGPGISSDQLEELALESAAAPVVREKSFSCGGHADLLVQIRVSGLTEQNSLYVLDAIGGVPEAQKGGWPGWNAETMGYTAALSAQDWAKEYGLAVDGLILRNPLTAAQIDEYMALVPEDASAMRRELVWWALSSVGKIPYYWGGKTSAGGYEGNQFGAVVAADEDGRFLKGLDCSGWISWVYLSATGRRLPGESTRTMISCGTGITKEELQPGDICIRLGDMPHAVMFLGWTETGQMLCVQETSGDINNVEVGIVKPDWPYYRRLVE